MYRHDVYKYLFLHSPYLPLEIEFATPDVISVIAFFVCVEANRTDFPRALIAAKLLSRFSMATISLNNSNSPQQIDLFVEREEELILW